MSTTTDDERPERVGTMGLADVTAFATRHNVNPDNLLVVTTYLVRVNDRVALREFVTMILTNDIDKYRRHPWKDFHVLCAMRMLPVETAMGAILGGVIGTACTAACAAKQ